jgi:hypothetical protein
MKRIIPILLLAFALSGCATFQAEIAKLQQAYTVATTATVPASTAQIVVSSFEVLEAGSTEYFKYCKQTPADSRCAPGTVTNPGPLRLAIKYIRQGRAARDQIKAAGKTGALISSTAYNLLVTAVNDLATTPVSTFGASK